MSNAPTYDCRHCDQKYLSSKRRTAHEPLCVLHTSLWDGVERVGDDTLELFGSGCQVIADPMFAGDIELHVDEGDDQVAVLVNSVDYKTMVAGTFTPKAAIDADPKLMDVIIEHAVSLLGTNFAPGGVDGVDEFYTPPIK